ncbi:MAG: GntR family transcriptional regulator [Bacillota bacterium]|nr:MAG: GntR family transcriptional regulator [Bacillota bacterium]
MTRPRSLVQMISEHLREGIFRGDYRPGQRLIQADLAAALGVSRIPVREALHRLAEEGLVVYHPRRGALVRRPDVREVHEAFETVKIIQRAAMELAVERVTDAAIADLERTHATLLRESRSGRSNGLVALNRRFHRTLYESCGLARLHDCVEILLFPYSHGIHVMLRRRGLSAAAEHDEILQALRGRDRERLITATLKHTDHNCRALLDTLGRDGQPGGRAVG